MIITLAGALGSGKSTVAKALAKILGYEHTSTGDFMRKMAKNRGVTFEELIELAKSNPEIDKEIDMQSKNLVDSGSDNLVIDSRLAFHFIPQSIKFYLDVDEEEATKRIFLAKRKDEPNESPEKVLEFIKRRRASENQRYNKLYNINCHEPESCNFDCIIDTTGKNVGEVIEAVLDYLILQGLADSSLKGKGLDYSF